MSEELDSESEVILEIENTPITCNKQQLIRHSDYFKVMFEGNFIERDKKVVKLEGIDLSAMNIILALLWDNSFIMEEDCIPSVLQTSCMLQFVEIKTLCVQRLLQLLSPQNCIKIWLFAEQLDVQPLYLKAKSLALIEFNTIKDLESILELELKQLHNYLANTNLQCNSELDVFQVCMKWWYENSGKLCKAKCTESFRTETFLRLLSCLDCKRLVDSDIQEIMTYPDLSENVEIMKILHCIIDMRRGSEIDCDEHILKKSKMFCNSKSRTYKQCPCIVVHSFSDALARKKQKMSSKKESIRPVHYSKSTVHHDMFKRKRYFTRIDTSESSVGIIYYDKAIKNYRKLLSISKEKCQNLHGFKVVGYKEFIFLFGGEYLLGKGDWNKNFWVFDTIGEFWERKSVIPFVRRHFQSCVCGNYLYIIGGTGNFRVIQDNLFWYNYKEDKWSRQIELPCPGRQIKCCSWNNQLFLLNINDKCGYLFDQCNVTWCKMNICDDLELGFRIPDEYALFSYNNHIYIKGDNLIEMDVTKQQLVVKKCMQLTTSKFDEIESIICENVVYTLYKQTCPEELASSYSLSFEKYYIDSHISELIFKDILEETLVPLEGGEYVFNMSTAIFGFQHYELFAADNYVNEF